MSIDQCLDMIVASELPKLYLGQEVRTENGRGIIVRLTMPLNGLYISPEGTIVVVWYGMDDDRPGCWVSQSFSLQSFMQQLANNPQPIGV